MEVPFPTNVTEMLCDRTSISSVIFHLVGRRKGRPLWGRWEGDESCEGWRHAAWPCHAVHMHLLAQSEKEKGRRFSLSLIFSDISISILLLLYWGFMVAYIRKCAFSNKYLFTWLITRLVTCSLITLFSDHLIGNNICFCFYPNTMIIFLFFGCDQQTLLLPCKKIFNSVAHISWIKNTTPLWAAAPLPLKLSLGEHHSNQCTFVQSLSP